MDLVAAILLKRWSSLPANVLDPDRFGDRLLKPGHELQIRPRSGLALLNGIVLPNSPGTILTRTIGAKFR